MSFSGQYAIVRTLGRRGMRQSLEISETWRILFGRPEEKRTLWRPRLG
jgi:hypothetical protein